MNDTEKAIENLKETLEFVANTSYEINRDRRCRAIELAIEVLQEKAERENPKPLTLEQLRERIGKPVYVVHFSSSCSLKKPSEWLILKSCNPTIDYPFVIFEGCGLNAMYYCKGWIAYDHEPKEGTDD